MRQTLMKLFLAAVQSDTEAEFDDGRWRTRCLHCRAALYLAASGEPLNGATLEHVIPQSWFQKRAAQDLIGDLDGPNDLRNLALACPSCNQGKGRAHDKAGPSNQRAREVVEALFAKRQARLSKLWDTIMLTSNRKPRRSRERDPSYTCDACGEQIVIPVDLSEGESQQYVEDCPVCCRPNVISVDVDDDGEIRVWAEPE